MLVKGILDDFSVYETTTTTAMITYQELCTRLWLHPRNYAHGYDYIPGITHTIMITSQELCTRVWLHPRNYAYGYDYPPGIMHTVRGSFVFCYGLMPANVTAILLDYLARTGVIKRMSQCKCKNTSCHGNVNRIIYPLWWECIGHQCITL